jgi:hypothetical protein
MLYQNDLNLPFPEDDLIGLRAQSARETGRKVNEG